LPPAIIGIRNSLRGAPPSRAASFVNQPNGRGTAPPLQKCFMFMKVVVKKKDNSIPVAISTEYIKLQDAMKYANIVYSGGEAKTLILEEQVQVNGEVCTMRGKKLRPGDKFTFMGQTYLITEQA